MSYVGLLAILTAKFPTGVWLFTWIELSLSLRLMAPLALPMPPQSVDWSGLRAAAVSLNSVRDAAMRAAANLPPNEQTRFVERVNKRAYRERWLETASKLAESPRPNGGKPMSNSVQSGAVVVANAVAQNCNAARNYLSKASLNGAKSFSKLPGEALTDAKTSAAFRNVTAATAQIGGWDENKDKGGVNVMVNVGILGQ